MSNLAEAMGIAKFIFASLLEQAVIREGTHPDASGTQARGCFCIVLYFTIINGSGSIKSKNDILRTIMGRVARCCKQTLL